MDVDADNFEEGFAMLEEHLPRSAFVALDLEMTGITGPADTRVNGGDAPQVQYSKSRAVVTRPYNIVQVGICLFEERAPGQFTCRPFNFWVFPRPFSERDPDGKQVKVDDHFMGLSASSMAFLAGNGLDFNRWVGKGVSYTNAETEEALLRALPACFRDASGVAAGSAGDNGVAASKAANNRDKPEATKPADIDLVNDTMNKVADFAASESSEMKLPGMNTFLALIVRNKITEQHPGLVVEKRASAANPNWTDRWVAKLDDSGRKERDEATRQRFMTHIGFRRVWTLLKTHRRPAVFHNGFFDLLFMAAAFECYLPHALWEFKSLIHSHFPVLFDTKVLAESADLAGCLGNSRTALPELSNCLATKLKAAAAASRSQQPSAQTTAAEPELEPEADGAVAGDAMEGVKPAAEPDAQAVSFSLPEGFDAYSEAEPEGEQGAVASKGAAFHTAGYDAYQTGRVFAFYRARIGDYKTLEFMNQVFLMFSAFQLRLNQVSDNLMFDGIVRHIYDVDTSALNNRSFLELLKPVLEEGKRKVAFRWCGDNRSLLLILHGHSDVAKSAPEREACEKCLDALLKPQEEQGKLRFRSLEEHLDGLASMASSKDANSGGAAKRRRFA